MDERTDVKELRGAQGHRDDVETITDVAQTTPHTWDATMSRLMLREVVEAVVKPHLPE